MCLNLPFEDKTNWHFTKWDGLNKLFVIQCIRCFKIFWGSANFLLQIALKMEKKMKNILSPAYSLKLKNIILFLNRGLIFFQMVIFATLFRRCSTLWKSTLKMTLFRRCPTLFRRCLTFNSTLKNTTLTYKTLLQRWFDVVQRRDVKST